MAKTLSTKQMGWSEKDNKLTAFASDLQLAPGEWPLTLEVEDHQTHAVRKFVGVIVHRDREGDILDVTYSCPREGTTLVIFND